MKQLFVCALMLGALVLAEAQESDPKFTLTLSSDSILLGNYFIAKFTLENAEGSNFLPPQFEHFEIVAGPNQSSEFNMINGVVSQKLSYTYYLKPFDIGNFYIEPATIDAADQVLESDPYEVMVLPNPEEIIINPQLEKTTDFFDLNFGDFDSFFFPNRKLERPSRQEDQKNKKAKRKRKVYKM